MINPTVGRIVWYYPSHCKPGTEPRAAIITKVFGDTLVNVGFWEPTGHPGIGTQVKLVQDDNWPADTTGGFCTWMPYQRGQAARSEELERENEALRTNANTGATTKAGV